MNCKGERYLLVSFVDVGLGIGEAAGHYTAENKVEWAGPDPLVLQVVDFKRAILWYPASKLASSHYSEQPGWLVGLQRRLYRAEIHANYLGLRMGIG